ncbi:hypothetical protein DEIPH_ctg012orf0038 [Deinococcus phoenicis]|uniref:Cyclodeaminase/cyclohydrolase domain-containing protein n=1 Tax=Deinococcus phoenicis TaxID=1476583 RepID=A0A016QSU7_9DEIO|nr:cyclodeaminase/cyclohydrolase family protein [Deinococcus phoenicis]EYB68977.1 hypothetical protein DEIPH_ctg012orf0038 [Deinococcus phoenicis]
MASLWQRPAQELLQTAASGAPTPGGGSTAALTGAFGTALLEMALNITLRKNGAAAEALRPLLSALTGLRGRLQALADEDVRAFQAYVQATRLPEGEERAAALNQAGRAAIQVPLHLARTAVEVLGLTGLLVPQVHAEVTSDVGAGAAILEGALHAALLTVEINLPHMAPGEQETLKAERDSLEARGRHLAAETLRRTRERLPG